MKRTRLVKAVSFNAVCVLAALLGASRAAQATPFTFEFDVPEWSFVSNPSLFGTSSIVDITVDNGAANDLSQSYLNSQITQLSLRTVGGTYTNVWTDADVAVNTDPSASYLSTDAGGKVSLDLLASSVMSAIVFMNGGGFMQLGVITPEGGDSTFVVDNGADDAQYVPFTADGGYTGFQQFGTLISGGATAVPEPGTLGLVGIALAGLAVIRRRSAKPRMIALRRRA